jgi:hypothetical protein
MVLGPRERAQQIQDNIRGKPSGGGTNNDPQPPKPAKKPSFAETIKLNATQAREKLGALALTNNYFVSIPINVDIRTYLNNFNTKDSGYEITRFVEEKLGFYCSEATLPVSSFATAEVKDNYLGVTQEFAHTRLYTDLDFTFYVDSDYTVLRYFEYWMDYISGTYLPSFDFNQPERSSQQKVELSKNYLRRMNFPDSYKVDTVKIIKFEKDYDRALEYQFINAFPKGLTSIPVSYGPADLLKVTVTFNFDRYVFTPTTFPKVSRGTDQVI